MDRKHTSVAHVLHRSILRPSARRRPVCTYIICGRNLASTGNLYDELVHEMVPIVSEPRRLDWYWWRNLFLPLNGACCDVLFES